MNSLSSTVYDFIAIGAGSAGLTAAEFAASMGANVALVDKKPSSMGGGCLHTDCVPSKAFIYAAKQPKAAWKNVQKHAQKTIHYIQESQDNPEAYAGLGIDTYFGAVTVQGARSIKVGKHVLEYKKLLIATGSSPRIPDIRGLKTVEYETNESIFHVDSAPKSIAIIGGGLISVEMAFAFRNLGIEVHIIEHNSHILHLADDDASKAVYEALVAKGVHIHTSASIASVKKKGVKKEIALQHGDASQTVRVGHILVAAGRQANIPSGLKKQNVSIDNDMIIVNDRWRTSADHIYAVGDCTNFGRNFTHVAASAAVQAVSHALYGVKTKQDLRNQPSVFFTEPEVAQVGPTVAELERSGIGHDVHLLPFTSIDKALTDKNDGFLKATVDQSGTLLGATVVGPRAGELIGYFAIALDRRWKLTELAGVPLPYPTLSFGIKELAYRVQLEQISKRKKLLGFVRKLTVR